MKKKYENLVASYIIRSIALIAGGTALAQLIGILSMPIITRLYTPTELGMVSLFLSFSAFWGNVISLRYEHALLAVQEDSESHVIINLAKILIILMSVFGALFLLYLQNEKILEFNILPIWSPIIAFFILIGIGFFAIYRSWALRAGMIKEISSCAISRAGVLAGSKIGLGLLGAGVVGLLIAELIGACTSLLRIVRSTQKHFFASKPAKVSFMNMKDIGVKFRKFPLIEAPSALLDALAFMLPLPLVASLYGAEAAGFFGLARMIISVPNSQIGTAVADVFQVEIAKALHSDNALQARELFYRILKKMAWLGLIPLFGSVLILPWAVSFVFGPDWTQAGLISICLGPWLYAAFIVSPVSRLLSVLEVQEWKLVYDISALCLLLICYFLAKMFDLDLIEFCIFISFAKVIGYIIYGYILHAIVQNKIK